MNNSEKIKYLNEGLEILAKGLHKEYVNVSREDSHFCKLPKKFFKFTKINDHSLDALSHEYIYLAPANELDDPFECSTKIDIDNSYCKNTKSLTKDKLLLIVDLALQFVEPEQKEMLREIIMSCINSDNTINQKKALRVLQEYNTNHDIDVSLIINSINLSNQIPDDGFITLIRNANSLSVRTGIYSLTEEKDNQVLWTMYANNYTGMCIEYDFSKMIEHSFNIFPVIYTENRNNDVIDVMIASYINGFIEHHTQGRIATDRTQYLQLLLTKHLQWEFQKEWRIIGDAGEKKVAPTINAIYLGAKCSNDNKNKVIQLAKEKGFTVSNQEIDIVNLNFKYKKII